jgi:hypothetical protein
VWIGFDSAKRPKSAFAALAPGNDGVKMPLEALGRVKIGQNRPEKPLPTCGGWSKSL